MLTQMVRAYTQNRMSIFPYQLIPKIQYATSLMEFLECYGILFNSKNVYIFKNMGDKLEYRCRGDQTYNKVTGQN